MAQLNLYPPSAHNGGHLEVSSDIDKYVHEIHKACKGLGTDEKVLIKVLGTKSPEKRNLIAIRYHQLHHKTLKQLIKGETSGHFGYLLQLICTPLPETECQLILDATRGIGTNEDICVQILSGRTNAEMQILRKTFFNMTGKDISVVIGSEINGDFKHALMAMLQASQSAYNPQFHTFERAKIDANELYKAGQGRVGTNEAHFIRILVESPPQYLKILNDAYHQQYHRSILQAIEREFSGNAKKSLMLMVELILSPYNAIARILDHSMRGMGTKEMSLSTTIVRYQNVLPQVKKAYKNLFGKKLKERIKKETDGKYEDLLLAIFKASKEAQKEHHKNSHHGMDVKHGHHGHHKEHHQEHHSTHQHPQQSHYSQQQPYPAQQAPQYVPQLQYAQQIPPYAQQQPPYAQQAPQYAPQQPMYAKNAPQYTSQPPYNQQAPYHPSQAPQYVQGPHYAQQPPMQHNQCPSQPQQHGQYPPQQYPPSYPQQYKQV